MFNTFDEGDNGESVENYDYLEITAQPINKYDIGLKCFYNKVDVWEVFKEL